MSDAPAEKKGERIAKVMARAGLCSRRDAERWIEDGRVSLNGTVLTTPAQTVGEEDAVEVDGKPLPVAPESRLWAYHKPNGLVTTHKDPEGRPTVFDKLPKELGRVISVGRLDLNSEGLLLLTNDGELARKLEHPSTEMTRRYRVRVLGQIREDRLASLREGVTVEGIAYGPVIAALDKTPRNDAKGSANSWLTVDITEGKNREVRKVLEHIGLTVNRLLRVSYGPIELGNLQKGQIGEVPGKVVRYILRGGRTSIPRDDKAHRDKTRAEADAKRDHPHSKSHSRKPQDFKKGKGKPNSKNKKPGRAARKAKRK